MIRLARRVESIYRLCKVCSPFHKERKVEKFIMGVALGMVGGALIVANNCKIRNLVKKNQEDLMQKAEQYVDSKLEELEKKGESQSD